MTSKCEQRLLLGKKMMIEGNVGVIKVNFL